MIVRVGLQLARNPSLRDKAKADFALRDQLAGGLHRQKRRLRNPGRSIPHPGSVAL
jgi:hypothetical protein